MVGLRIISLQISNIKNINTFFPNLLFWYWGLWWTVCIFHICFVLCGCMQTTIDNFSLWEDKELSEHRPVLHGNLVKLRLRILFPLDSYRNWNCKYGMAEGTELDQHATPWLHLLPRTSFPDRDANWCRDLFLPLGREGLDSEWPDVLFPLSCLSTNNWARK